MGVYEIQLLHSKRINKKVKKLTKSIDNLQNGKKSLPAIHISRIYKEFKGFQDGG
jgi:hypothetical protein